MPRWTRFWRQQIKKMHRERLRCLIEQHLTIPTMSTMPNMPNMPIMPTMPTMPTMHRERHSCPTEQRERLTLVEKVF